MSEETKNNKVADENNKNHEEMQPELPGVPSADADKRIAELEEQVATLNDKYLRIYSEFDNFRKRTARERVEILNSAGEEILKSLLPVIDNFERAIKTNESATDVKAINEGIALISQMFKSILNQKGLQQVNSIGEIFDTDLHEAITNIPAPEPGLKGKVIDEVEKGYTLNGKIIRYAKVVVGA